MVNQNQQTIQEMQQHRQHVIGLATRETQSIINSRKQHRIVLSKEQSNAANKLFNMLRTTDNRINHLPVSYLTKESLPRKGTEKSLESREGS